MVKIQIYTSSELSLSLGVPQGLTFGPLLFLLFVNDLSTYINDYVGNYFADHTMIYNEGSGYTELQHNLHNRLTQRTLENGSSKMN